MIIIYLLLLILIHIIVKNKSSNVKAGIRLVYNLLFVMITQVAIRLLLIEKDGISEILRVIGESLFMTVQNITFNGDISWAEQMSTGFQAQMWIIVFIASLLTVESVLVVIFGKVLAQLKLKIKGSFMIKQYIIAGKRKDIELLVSDVQSKIQKPFIVAIPSEQLDDSDELYHKCRIEKQDFLHRLDQKKEYHIVLLPDTQYTNLELLYQLNNTVAEHQNIQVTAFLDNDTIRFHDIHTDNIDACLLSEEQLMVHKFFDECSPIDILKNNHSFSETDSLPFLEKPYKICVIGFGDMGQEFLLYSFENSSFITKDKRDSFHAIVIDEASDIKREEFLTKIPFFENHHQIQFVEALINSEDYFHTIKTNLDELDQVIVSTDNTQINVNIAINLCRYFDRIGFYDNRPQIVVILNEVLSGAEKILSQYPNIRIIDINQEILNYEVLIERRIDIAAKTTNEQYNKSSTNGSNWNQLGLFTQASNRAVIRDMYNKKTLFDLCHAETEEVLDFLAQYEHSRWNAFYYAHGWREMSVSDLTEKEKADYITKHPNEKRHICLVSWEELDMLPQKTPGLLKYYDLENVKTALGMKS